MRARHPRLIPRIWLMTDERMGEGLLAALLRLPRGAGVVFRHYATPVSERRAIYARVRRIVRRRGLRLLTAGDALPGADGVHGRHARRGVGWLSRPVHSRREAIVAVRAGADMIFVSPLFATRSHPGSRALGPVRVGLMLRGMAIPTIALGGMSARRFKQLSGLKLHGWAAIDAWGAKPALRSDNRRGLHKSSTAPD